jgi:serine-threonine kinase receptor-associated protein
MKTTLTYTGLVLSLSTRVRYTKPGSPQTLPQLRLHLQISQRRSLSSAAKLVLTVTRRVWDTHTGEEIYTIQHHHIVRAIAFPANSSSLLATGGMEKKLRIFDLDKIAPIANPSPNGTTPSTNNTPDSNVILAETGFEVGPGVHKGTIKSIVWTQDPNILVTAADDKVIRWWNLETRTVVKEQVVQGEIGSCEFTNVQGEASDIGGGLPVLTIAAGNTVYFFGGPSSSTLLKSVTLRYEVASVALHPSQRKFITGGMKDTWAKVYDYDTEQEIGMRSSSPWDMTH